VDDLVHDHAVEVVKNVVDVVSVLTVLGAMFNYLPDVAALFTLVWTIIRIYESKTVQGWLATLRDDDAE
jgi:hypothetical protein